jgi:GTP-binding protein Era
MTAPHTPPHEPFGPATPDTIDPDAPDLPTRCGHVVFAGTPNVGKSSLLNALLDTHLAMVSPRAQATRMPVTGLRTDGRVQMILHDLPGLLEPAYELQVRMRHVAHEMLGRADLILHLHPANEAPAPDFVALAGLDAPPRAPVCVVYTKGDLVSRERRAALLDTAPVVATSVPESIEALAAWIGQELPERPFEHDPDDVGTQPLRFFVVEYLREAAFDLLDDELPYSVTADVEEFREGSSPVYIRAVVYVERESQKRILIGRGGATIRAIGAHARRRLEALMGAPVYLDTWVKVLPRWRRDPALLSGMGFPAPPENRR